MLKKITTEEFIQKVREIHGDRYDYSKVDYRNAKTKVIIICKEHGEFEQTPDSHRRGGKCPSCALISRAKKRTYTSDKFISKAINKHGDKYDYSKVDYKNARTKVIIICKEHGEFEQEPVSHLSGYGCYGCGIDTLKNYFRKKMDDVLLDFKNAHGDKYDYSKVEYVNSDSKVIIICPVHGDFEQVPAHHLKGGGCASCKISKGESRICAYLQENDIKYKQEKTFKGMKDMGLLKCDFYLPQYNLVIEYNGIQHYEPVSVFGGEEGFLSSQKRDKIKAEYLKENNIDLLVIPYTEKKNIEKILEEKLFK